MSYLIHEDIPCTHCEFPNSVEVWSIVNVKEDPELKEILLGGELNMAECTACKKIFYAEHFLLYHDPETELMAFVYPYALRDNQETYVEKTRVDFEAAQSNSSSDKKLSYRPLTLFGLDELIQLMEEEDEAALQGEIVEVLSKQLGFSVKKLRPEVARRQKIPRVLPYSSESSIVNPSTMIKAIELIESENDRLSVYTNLKQKLKESSALSIAYE